MKLSSPIKIDTVASCRDSLGCGRISSRELVEQCLEAALDPVGEGARVFTKVFASTARVEAEAVDYLPVTGNLPLRGLPVAIKDLFDVEGQVTTAGSVVLADASPAARDAAIVTRLRDAAAVLIGRTNMTEFAFSGLGLNPHYGTPRSPYEREEGRIPGGSSSGAAISVTDGMAVAAIGSDTGGSIRIPAALCGLTGFKPTARRMPMEGVLPLSPSLDSIGPIAPTVACCAAIDEVLSGERHTLKQPATSDIRLGVLQGYVHDDLDQHVAASFENAIAAIAHAGATIVKVNFTALTEIPACYQNGGLASYESHKWHRDLIEKDAGRYDPRVLTRIIRGRDISDAEYRTLLDERQRIIAEADKAFSRTEIWVMPTVPRIAPRIADLEASDETYFDANTAMLRNTSVFNFLDGCAISIPCHRPGDAPVGLMLAARGGADAFLLRTALVVEDILRKAGLAIAG